jgi:hypothetical protein
MKTNSFFTFLKKMIFVLPFVYLSSCQKEVLQNAVDNSAAITKVNSWLESRKELEYVLGSSVDNIKTNLDFDKLHYEQLSETEKLIIIPLKASFISEVNKGKNPLNLFLLIVNKDGNIRKGNIVQFTAKDGKKTDKLPENTFYNFYNKDWLVCDGSFTFVNINDKILYQMDYAKGKLAAYAEKSSKVADNPNKFSSGPSDQFFDTCIEWYWLTFANGVLINEEYLYTDCGINVEEGGGGGGSGSGNEEAMFPVQKLWTVDADDLFWGWSLWAFEQLSGTKSPGMPGGGYFTNITHLNEGLIIAKPQNGYTWQKGGVTVSYSGSIAKSIVSGIVHSTNPAVLDDLIAPTTETFTFSQVFP